MKKSFHCISILIVFLILPHVSLAEIPIPARIGGTITIDGVPLTDTSAGGYTIKITKQDGTVLTPSSEDTDGLSSAHWYIIDIPLYDADYQTGGVNPDDTLVIHVYKENKELTVTSPQEGEITVGDSGSTTQVDISLKKSNSILAAIISLLLDEQGGVQ